MNRKAHSGQRHARRSALGVGIASTALVALSLLGADATAEPAPTGLEAMGLSADILCARTAGQPTHVALIGKVSTAISGTVVNSDNVNVLSFAFQPPGGAYTIQNGEYTLSHRSRNWWRYWHHSDKS